MTSDQVRRLLHAKPFQPFDMHLADGRSLPVDHPELLGFTPGGRTVGVGLPDDTIEIVDLLLVTSLKPRQNGRTQRKRRS